MITPKDLITALQDLMATAAQIPETIEFSVEMPSQSIKINQEEASDISETFTPVETNAWSEFFFDIRSRMSELEKIAEKLSQQITEKAESTAEKQ